MAAPSLIRRKASLKSRAPQTKGMRNGSLSDSPHQLELKLHKNEKKVTNEITSD